MVDSCVLRDIRVDDVDFVRVAAGASATEAGLFSGAGGAIILRAA